MQPSHEIGPGETLGRQQTARVCPRRGGGVNREAQRVSASFEATDDLLWQAFAGRLPTLGAVTLGRSGWIGPLVELAMATAALPDAYRAVTVEPPVFHQLIRAVGQGAICGAGARDRAGVFPLSRFDPDGDGPGRLIWEQWAKHAENAAITAGLARGLAAGLIGAFGELLDNVFEHSGRPESGVVAYAASDGAFEFVVADAGRGVLASLRENPEFAGLSDSGTALRVAASDGASRHAQSSGHGYGIGRLFRALAHDAAELRFRSGDHALRLWGDAPSLTGQVELAQKAWLDGLTVSVRCAPNAPRRRSWAQCGPCRGLMGSAHQGDIVREEVVDRRTFRGRELRPSQPARLGQIGPPPPNGSREGVGLDQGYSREVAAQRIELTAAAPDNEGERAVDAIGERAELGNVPVDPLAPAAAGRELEREDLDLGAVGDELGPPSVVMLGAAVHVQGGRHARRRHLRPGQQYALHRMEVVGAWDVRQDAVIGCRDEGYAERLQGGEDRRPFLKLPPALDRPILVDAGHDDRRAFGNEEARRELGAGGDMRLASRPD